MSAFTGSLKAKSAGDDHDPLIEAAGAGHLIRRDGLMADPDWRP